MMGETDRIDMTITLPGLTPAQAIALHSMFQCWQSLGSMGASRMVAFYVDGDGNFRPHPRVSFSRDIYANMSKEQKQELWTLAHISRPTGKAWENGPEDEMKFDFDQVAWKLHD